LCSVALTDWEYVNIDIQLDPEGDTLPVDHFVEATLNRDIKISAAQHIQQLKDRVE
jgi:hypothetical protein